MFINASSYAVYLILVKPLMANYKPVSVITWVFTYGLILVFPFGISQLSEVHWPSMPPDMLARVIFVVVGTTYLAYLLNVDAMQTVTSTTVSFYIYLQPVFASVAAIAMHKDHLSFYLIIAALLIFSGVYMVSLYGRPIQKRVFTRKD